MRSIILHTTLIATLLPGVAGAQVSPAAEPSVAPHARIAAAHARIVAARAPIAAAQVELSGLQAAQATAQAAAPVQRRIAHPGSAPSALLLRASYPQDPADGMYRQAREALNRGEYRRAAQTFAQIPQRWPRSEYAPQAFYWQAFALSRGNASMDDLRAARTAIATLRSRYPNAQVRDAEALVQTINAQLAELGDVQGSAAVQRAATAAQQQGCPDPDDEDDTRVVALNALLQMDADRALPILKQVLAKRDACSAPLRRKAVFLISQKRSAETADILLDLVRNDPDRDVREQAIFWLSQVDGARSVEALEGILRTSDDVGLQEKAIFALSQHSSARAAELLRAYALRADAPEEMRAQAIFWIGQNHAESNSGFLRDLYGRISGDELKEKVIFSLAQQSNAQNATFLLDIAMNERESLEMRKQALFWAGQSGNVPLDRLIQLYDRIDDHEVKDQLIFVFAQNGSRAAVDKLMSIARNESDVELRKQATFWLGQSKDPRVHEFLLELING